ncbi:GNAT family N-acetyltransferase [Burkholderia orbicola]|uniref:GNAT family N-acetyltransferase n=1 Tax=Burkholderia orbicola TaxID=2978683 RepID=UPI001903A17B|nr:GNAT family N-acetyltransferase [Burkholderia orbicola]
MLTAELEGKIAGCIEVRNKENVAYIGTLAVSPSMQNDGLGKTLPNKAEQFARQHWPIGIAVMVLVSARQELIDFCLRRSYTRTGEPMRYPLDAGVGTPRDANLTIETLTKDLGRR